MANRIKGITVEIGGDTTKLQTALKGVNGEIRNTQSALRDVEKLLKLDPGNTELLAQKHRLLGDAVNETKEKLATLKTAAEQANTALANGEISQDQYDALQREIIETENNLRDLERQAGQSAVALQKISATGEKLKTVGDNISSAGQKLLPVTAGVTALGTAAVSTAANFESSMSQVQATMGITKDAMSTVNGESVNTMDTLSALAKKMGSETAFSASECAEALNYLALAGYDTQQMCDTLPTVLNLAAAKRNTTGWRGGSTGRRSGFRKSARPSRSGRRSGKKSGGLFPPWKSWMARSRNLTRTTGTALWSMPRCTAGRTSASLLRTGWR